MHHSQHWPSRKVQLLRCGNFDHYSGRFTIHHGTLAGMAITFPKVAARLKDVPVNIAHDPKTVAGRIRALAVHEDGLWAEVDWLPDGLRAICERGFRYLSAECNLDRMELTGAALVLTPAIKHMAPIEIERPEVGRHLSLSETLRSVMAGYP